MLWNVGNNCYQNTRKRSTEVHLASIDPRLKVAEPGTAVKMFK